MSFAGFPTAPCSVNVTPGGQRRQRRREASLAERVGDERSAGDPDARKNIGEPKARLKYPALAGMGFTATVPSSSSHG